MLNFIIAVLVFNKIFKKRSYFASNRATSGKDKKSMINDMFSLNYWSKICFCFFNKNQLKTFFDIHLAVPIKKVL